MKLNRIFGKNQENDKLHSQEDQGERELYASVEINMNNSSVNVSSDKTEEEIRELVMNNKVLRFEDKWGKYTVFTDHVERIYYEEDGHADPPANIEVVK